MKTYSSGKANKAACSRITLLVKDKKMLSIMETGLQFKKLNNESSRHLIVACFDQKCAESVAD